MKPRAGHLRLPEAQLSQKRYGDVEQRLLGELNLVLDEIGQLTKEMKWIASELEHQRWDTPEIQNESRQALHGLLGEQDSKNQNPDAVIDVDAYLQSLKKDIWEDSDKVRCAIEKAFDEFDQHLSKKGIWKESDEIRCKIQKASCDSARLQALKKQMQDVTIIDFEKVVREMEESCDHLWTRKQELDVIHQSKQNQRKKLNELLDFLERKRKKQENEQKEFISEQDYLVVCELLEKLKPWLREACDKQSGLILQLETLQEKIVEVEQHLKGVEEYRRMQTGLAWGRSNDHNPLKKIQHDIDQIEQEMKHQETQRPRLQLQEECCQLQSCIGEQENQLRIFQHQKQEQNQKAGEYKRKDKENVEMIQVLSALDGSDDFLGLTDQIVQLTDLHAMDEEEISRNKKNIHNLDIEQRGIKEELDRLKKNLAEKQARLRGMGEFKEDKIKTISALDKKLQELGNQKEALKARVRNIQDPHSHDRIKRQHQSLLEYQKRLLAEIEQSVNQCQSYQGLIHECAQDKEQYEQQATREESERLRQAEAAKQEKERAKRQREEEAKRDARINRQFNAAIAAAEAPAKKRNAFKKIYQALRDGQTQPDCFKTNFLKKKEGLSESELSNAIVAHCLKNPNSRTATAWRLAEIHYNDCTDTNKQLFIEIYKWSFQNSVFGLSRVTGTFFVRSSALNKKIQNITLTEINNGKNKKHSRTASICHALQPRTVRGA